MVSSLWYSLSWWSLIAGRLPGRKADEVKIHWESNIKTKLISTGFDPDNHLPELTITCSAYCNDKHHHHSELISSRTITKSLSSPPRKLSRYDHLQYDGEIDLSLKIGLPDSATHDHNLISTVVIGGFGPNGFQIHSPNSFEILSETAISPCLRSSSAGFTLHRTLFISRSI